MALVGQFPDSNYKCGMDNLFISPKFAKIAKNDSGKGIMIYGVCRVSLGIPNCIHQVAVTKKEELLKNRGVVKASVIRGDSKCDGLVAVTFYDSKPVYFISNACGKSGGNRITKDYGPRKGGGMLMGPFIA